MSRFARCFLRTAIASSLAALATFAFGQTPVSGDRMPTSRLAEMTGVSWKALSSQQKAVTLLQPTLTEARARLKLTVPGYEIAQVRKDDVDFIRLDVPGAGVTPTVGRPELPVLRRFVAVPEGARVRVTVKAGRPTTLTNVNVYPVQEPLPEQQPTPATMAQPKFAFARDFYRLDRAYPARLVTVSAPMKLRDLTVVLVEIATMQYNGAKKTLVVYPDVDVDLSFSKPFARATSAQTPAAHAVRPAVTESRTATPAATARPLSANVTAAKQLQRLGLADSVLVNWDLFHDHVFHLRWDYLILTPDAFYADIQAFAQWKRDKGLVVKVTKLSEIAAAPTPAQIQSYIRSAYVDHGIDYVLLVGDTNAMPGYNYTGSGGTISDYYYTLVSGGDYLPDLAVGRFSGRTSTEITRLANKSINYEKTPTAGAWKRRALCISDSGYFQVTSDYNHTLMENNGFTVDKLYASLGNANVAHVTSAINDGRLLVSYRGHGSQTGWSTSGFSNANVGALTNGTLLPVIISPTCLTGMYDYAASDCYSECWLKSGAAAPLGAVAYWGSARISYGGYNDQLSMGAFDTMFIGGQRVVGTIVNNAKLRMISVYGITDATTLLELHMFNLFGDPELHIAF